MKSILSGIRVVEWASWLSTPTAGSHLGDLGADVIKIEQPSVGDPARGTRATLPDGKVVMHETANRNKRSLTLDLTHPDGRAILMELVKKSDVFITSYNHARAKQVSADYETLREINPALVYGYGGSGFGPRGPRAEKRSFDVLAQATSGLMWSTGDDGWPEPQFISGGPLDTAAGVMLAYGVVAALLARERDEQRRGQIVSASLLGTALQIQALNVNTTLWTGRPIDRYTHTIAGPLLATYECGDREWIMLAEPQFARFWPEFCNALNLTQDDLESARGDGELRELIEQRFATMPRDKWIQHFDDLGCKFAYGPVNTMTDAVNDAQAMANDYVTEFDHPTLGRTRTLGFPLSFSATPASIRRPACEHGQHTEEILIDVLGYSWDDIRPLQDARVIG